MCKLRTYKKQLFIVGRKSEKKISILSFLKKRNLNFWKEKIVDSFFHIDK